MFSVTCTTAAGAFYYSQSRTWGMGGREMEKLRGTCQHPPTGLSSVPSTDVYQIPCESGSSGHSLELEKLGGKSRKGNKRELHSGDYYPAFSLMSPAIWVQEDE
jgi:hypothetical protein